MEGERCKYERQKILREKKGTWVCPSKIKTSGLSNELDLQQSLCRLNAQRANPNGLEREKKTYKDLGVSNRD